LKARFENTALLAIPLLAALRIGKGGRGRLRRKGSSFSGVHRTWGIGCLLHSKSLPAGPEKGKKFILSEREKGERSGKNRGKRAIGKRGGEECKKVRTSNISCLHHRLNNPMVLYLGWEKSGWERRTDIKLGCH